MAPTVAHTLDVARSQIGVTEPGVSGESPGQTTKYNAWYASWSGQGGYRDTYWCSTFQSWVLAVAGFSVTEAGRYGNCGPWVRWLKAHDRWHSAPRPGALVFFDWDGDGAPEHIGMVESVRPDGRVVTIEGNASRPGVHDGVWRMVRRAAILGYGHLPYAEPAKKPSGPQSLLMPGPVVVSRGGAAPATVDARVKPWRDCPAMPVGFGGPEDKTQATWAAYWFALMARFAPGYFASIMAVAAGRREVARHEIGRVTLRVVERMAKQARITEPFRGVVPSVAWSIFQPK